MRLLAARDIQALGGDIGGVIGAKESDGLGGVFGQSSALSRDAICHGLQVVIDRGGTRDLGETLVLPGLQTRGDVVGADAIDGDLGGSQFNGGRAGKADHAVL